MGRIVFMPEYKEKGLKASAVQKMLEDALQDYFGKYDNITIRKKINCPEGWTKGKGEKVDINNDVTGFTLHYSLERKLIFGEWKISFILDPSIISNQNDLGKANIFGNFKEIITGQAGPCEKKGACGSIDLEQRI